MDFTMGSSSDTTSTTFPVWDLAVTSGVVDFIDGNPGDVQAASIAAFLQLGSIPQLPDLGVPWVEFLTRQVSFGNLDAAIRQSAANANVSQFVPQYDILDGNLTVTMKAVQQAGGS